jgi:iron(III) transport system permease protein
MRLTATIWVSLLLVVLSVLTLYPLGTLFYGSLHTTPPGMPGEFNLNGYREVLSAENFRILVDTLGIAFVKTAIAVALAVLFAWIVARTDTPGRGTLEVLIALPFFIPPVITATAWTVMGNPQVGTINLLWRWLTGTDSTIINVYSYFGVIWHMIQYSTPFIFLFIVDAFRAFDPSLEESSRMSGASRWQTFRRVTIILLLPITTSAFILSFMRGVEAFESPLIFGRPADIYVLTTEIYRAINVTGGLPEYQYATALAFSVLLLMFLLVFFQWWLLGNRSYQTVTGKGYSPGIMKLGKWRWVTFSLCVLFFLIAVALPFAQLLVGSFFRLFGFYSWDMLTLEHYEWVFENRQVWRAFYNTMLLGVLGATATMILGAMVAYVSVRTRWRGRRLIETLAWLPWMMPGMVLGVGFLWGFAIIPGPIQIYGTVWALLLAYVTLGTPLAVRIMNGTFTQLSFDIEECSRVHGASWLQTLWRILIALAWPALAVGWILTFFGIMRELSASVLLYAVGSEVLSVVMVRMLIDGQPERVTVIGLMMMLLVFLFRWVQHLIVKQRLSIS